MDRNQITGLVMMLLLLTVYFQFFAPDVPEPVDELQEIVQDKPYVAPVEQTSLDGSQAIDQSSLPNQNDSLINAMNEKKFGVFASYAAGSEQDIVIENNDVILVFSNKGGFVKEITLKNYKTYDMQPLVLLNEQSSDMDIWVKSNYQPINISDLYFQFNNVASQIAGEDSLTLNFSIDLDNNRKIEQIYTVFGSGYQVGYQLKMTGMDGVIDNEDIQMNWVDRMITVESQVSAERLKATVNYLDTVEGYDYLSQRGDDTESEIIANPVKWLSFKQQFFLSGIIAENNFKSATVTSEVNPLDSAVVKIGTMNLTIPIGDVKSDAGKFTYYFGPADYEILETIGDDFEQNVDLGWLMFRMVNKWLVLPIFHFLQQFIPNYGLLIIVLVIIIRIILSPLTYKSHMSQAKMKVVKPELDALKERLGGDQQKFQQEQMAFYSKAGINPLSGCIPMLLQFPILLALFNFFPNAIELRQESFLWAHDLSTYDSVWDLPFTIPWYGDHVSLFTLLMTASTLLITHANSQMNTQMQGPMKSMQYMMPFMFLFFLNSYSSGLTFYYFVTNIVSFAQIALFKKVIDEDKVLALMEENKKKNANKKKSGFQVRLQEAMKASQEAQSQKKKKKK